MLSTAAVVTGETFTLQAPIQKPETQKCEKV